MAHSVVAGPHDGFTVVVADLASVASSFAHQHETTASAVDTAAHALAATSGMAGDDRVMAAWRNRYDTLAGLTWLAAGAVVASEHSIAIMLTDTADAYLDADHHSTPADLPPPAHLARPRPSRRLPGGPPTATGDTGQDVPDDLAEYLPDGDAVRLRSAAAAWRTLAGSLDDSAYDCDAAFRGLIGHNSGATFSAMDAFWTRRFVPCALDPLYNAVPHAAGILAHCCDALADLIETTHHDVDNAATDAATDIPATVLLAAIPSGTPWTALASLIGKVSLVGRSDRYVQRARQNYLEGLHTLTDEIGPENDDRLRRALGTEIPPGPDPRHDPDVGVRATDVGDILGIGLRGTAWNGVSGPHPDPDSVQITEDRRVHILDGDGTGGGHRSGATKPNKTEFPPGWTDSGVIDSILSVARDPDRLLNQRSDGSFEVEGTRAGVRILVAVGSNGYVITGHPLGGPGVITNPP